MQDPSSFDRDAMLAQSAHLKGMGGIVNSSTYEGFIVKIRPSKWRNKIWIGKLETVEHARHVADAVYHYLGMPAFHFEKGVMTFPSITCMGTGSDNPVQLSTGKMCGSYVRLIAGGKAFRPQRNHFFLQLKNVITNPDFPFLAPPRTEVVVLDDDDLDFFALAYDIPQPLKRAKMVRTSLEVHFKCCNFCIQCSN